MKAELTDAELEVLAFTAVELWAHSGHDAGEYLSRRQLDVLRKAQALDGQEEEASVTWRVQRSAGVGAWYVVGSDGSLPDGYAGSGFTERETAQSWADHLNGPGKPSDEETDDPRERE